MDIQAVPGFLAIIVAAFVAFIAFLQWKIAVAKLNLDLFEKRLAVYELVREAVAHVNTHGSADEMAQRKLIQAGNISEFLFGRDIRDYITSMRERFIKLEAAHAQRRSEDPAARKQANDAIQTLFSEITDFYYNGADQFAHYMRMDYRIRRPQKALRSRPAPKRLL